MNAGGLSKRIVDMAGAFVGHLRGGLGYVAIIAAVLLASLSGSAVADTAALAAILVPMMRSAGYDVGRACGLMAAGGILYTTETQAATSFRWNRVKPTRNVDLAGVWSTKAD